MADNLKKQWNAIYHNKDFPREQKAAALNAINYQLHCYGICLESFQATAAGEIEKVHDETIIDDDDNDIERKLMGFLKKFVSSGVRLNDVENFMGFKVDKLLNKLIHAGIVYKDENDYCYCFSDPPFPPGVRFNCIVTYRTSHNSIKKLKPNLVHTLIEGDYTYDYYLE